MLIIFSISLDDGVPTLSDGSLVGYSPIRDLGDLDWENQFSFWPDFGRSVGDAFLASAFLA